MFVASDRIIPKLGGGHSLSELHPVIEILGALITVPKVADDLGDNMSDSVHETCSLHS